MTSLLLRDLVVVGVLCTTAVGQDVVSPRHVKVLPVFFVPKGEPAPTPQQSENLMRHLVWSQTRYSELLPGKNTFTIA